MSAKPDLIDIDVTQQPIHRGIIDVTLYFC